MTLIPTALVTRNDRRPTIEIPREGNLEAGIQIALFWNATIAPNDDGVAGGDAAIDYTRPLAGPMPLFTNDQRIMFGGGWGKGGWGEPGALRSPSGGWGGGGWGKGGWGVGGSTFTWTFPFNLRDGDYQIAAIYADRLGNLRPPPGTILTLRVEALPRPIEALTWNLVGDTFLADWTPTAEFKAVA